MSKCSLSSNVVDFVLFLCFRANLAVAIDGTIAGQAEYVYLVINLIPFLIPCYEHEILSCFKYRDGSNK